MRSSAMAPVNQARPATTAPFSVIAPVLRTRQVVTRSSAVKRANPTRRATKTLFSDIKRALRAPAASIHSSDTVLATVTMAAPTLSLDRGQVLRTREATTLSLAIKRVNQTRLAMETLFLG